MITKWFESPEFIHNIIERGLNSMLDLGEVDARGVGYYMYDKQYLPDSKEMAKAVAKWNEDNE